MGRLVRSMLCNWLSDFFFALRNDNIVVTNRVKAIIYALGFSSVCMINKFKIVVVDNEYIMYFLNGYLNDILGTVVFLLYLCIVLSFLNKNFTFRLIHVELMVLICGILWEYVTPLYRIDTVSDPFDILAYTVGGLLFWYACNGNSLMNDINTEKEQNKTR